jgi:hypothetical protein
MAAAPFAQYCVDLRHGDKHLFLRRSPRRALHAIRNCTLLHVPGKALDEIGQAELSLSSHCDQAAMGGAATSWQPPDRLSEQHYSQRIVISAFAPFLTDGGFKVVTGAIERILDLAEDVPLRWRALRKILEAGMEEGKSYQWSKDCRCRISRHCRSSRSNLGHRRECRSIHRFARRPRMRRHQSRCGKA